MQFNKILTYWYSIHKRNLPWRSTKDPYKIWLSEIILQQTQIKQGLPYYLDFVEHFPTVFHLANATEHQVLKRWQGLGYYSRARNLHKTAKHIAFNLNGIFPDNYRDLLNLKGVGDYTASAIASICYNEPTAVVDGNVYRVLSRIYGIYTPINSSKGQKEFKSLATSLIDKEKPDLFNQAIMEFGAIHCKPKQPKCLDCDFKPNCYAFNNNEISNLPVKLKKSKVKKRFFNYLVMIDRNNNIQLEKRTQSGIWQNLYQFPLIESKKSINKPKFLQRLTEIDLSLSSIELFNKKDIVHKLSHQHIYTKFWILHSTNSSYNTINLEDVEDYPVPVLIGNFISEFKEAYQ